MDTTTPTPPEDTPKQLTAKPEPVHCDRCGDPVAFWAAPYRDVSTFLMLRALRGSETVFMCPDMKELHTVSGQTQMPVPQS